jgi:hypothetical protein
MQSAMAFFLLLILGAAPATRVEKVTFSSGENDGYLLPVRAGHRRAGAVSGEMSPLLPQVPRKIPMGIWVGTNDSAFPLKVVRESRDALAASGFRVRLTEIPNHTHDYYGSAGSINNEVWAFLRQQRLGGDPKYQDHQFTRK